MTYTIRHTDQVRTPADIDRELSKVNAEEALLEAKLAEVRKRQDYLNEVFAARGGWERAFLVNNTGGHVHTSTRCGSCFITTEYVWLTEFSGQSQDEIIAAAGDKACTWCYPDAPVEITSRPGTIKTDEDRRLEQVRAERAAKNIEKSAKQLNDPATGEMMYKTERGAEMAAVQALADILWYGGTHPSAAEWINAADRVARAVAAKHGRDFIEVLKEFEAKAEAKNKRDLKAAEKDRRDRPAFYAQFS